MGRILTSSGGGGGISSSDVTAKSADVLAGTKTIMADSDDEVVEGGMANNRGVSTSLDCGASYTIPKGYHDGTGKITANSLASQTQATATASNLLANKTAVVGGVKLTGTMPDNTTTTSNGTVPGISSSYKAVPTREASALQMNTDTSGTSRISMCPPAGYYQGGGSSYVNRPSSDFGTVATGNVLSGQTFTSTAGIKVAGTMKNVAAIDTAVSVGANSPNVYVRMTNGAHIQNASSGYPEVAVALSNFGTATTGQVLSGKTFTSSAGLKVSGTIASQAGQTITPSTSKQTISCSGKYMTGNIVINAIPSNYVNPSSWSVFRNGAFSNGIGIAPTWHVYYGYNLVSIGQEQASKTPDYTPDTKFPTIPSSQSLCVCLNKWIPINKFSKVHFKITAVNRRNSNFNMHFGLFTNATVNRYYGEYYGGDPVTFSTTEGNTYGTIVKEFDLPLSSISSFGGNYFNIAMQCQCTFTVNEITFS